MRQIKDVQDRRTKEKVYIRTHIKAVITDDNGSTLEDFLGSNLTERLSNLEAIIQTTGDGNAFLTNNGTYKSLDNYLNKTEASTIYTPITTFNLLLERVGDIEANFVKTVQFQQTLSQYSTTSQVEQLLLSKVDKDGAKQLSTEDFTTEFKEKLESLENYNDSGIQDTIAGLEEVVTPVASLASFMEGASFVNTLGNIPINHRLVIASISADSALTLAETPSIGREIHVIIHNTSTNEIAVALPNSGKYVNTLDQTMTIDGASYGEINFISDGNIIYIKYI